MRALRLWLLATCTVLPSVARAEWPSLGEIVTRARMSSFPVIDAQGQLAIARASRAGAEVSWLANPYVEFQAYRGNNTKDLAFYSFAMIPIEINGQRPARIQEADALAKWKSLSHEEARARATGYAVVLYGGALVSRVRLELASKAEADAKTEADRYAARLLAGDATAVDQSLAEAELARWAQQRAEATIALTSAITELEALLQTNVGQPPALPPEPPPVRSISAEAYALRAQETAPAIRSMASESAFWRAQSDRASRDKNVPLNFIVNFGRTDFGEFQVGGGLSWTFPITQRAQGPVAVADASAERADTMRSATQKLVASRARGLWEQYTMLRTTLSSLDTTGIPAQERAVDAMMSAYLAGKTDFVRVLQVRRDLAQMRGRRLDLVLAAWQRLGDMVAITGELP